MKLLCLLFDFQERDFATESEVRTELFVKRWNWRQKWPFSKYHIIFPSIPFFGFPTFLISFDFLFANTQSHFLEIEQCFTSFLLFENVRTVMQTSI